MKLLNSNKHNVPSNFTIVRPNGRVVGRCADIYWDPYPSDVIVLSFIDLKSHTGVGCAVTLDDFDVVSHDNDKYLIFHNCRADKCIRIQKNGNDMFIGGVIAKFKYMERRLNETIKL